MSHYQWLVGLSIMDVSRQEGRAATALRATASVDAVSPGSAVNARLGAGHDPWPRGIEIRPAGHRTGVADRARLMPPLAREGLERALCRVLERRHPGVRFAIKDELDAAGQRTATSGDTDGLNDRL